MMLKRCYKDIGLNLAVPIFH